MSLCCAVATVTGMVPSAGFGGFDLRAATTAMRSKQSRFIFFLSSGGVTSEPEPDEEHDRSAHDHLDNGPPQGTAHVAIADVSDCDQLDDDDHISDRHGRAQIADQEGKRVEHSAGRGPDTGDRGAHPPLPPPAQVP